MKKFFFILALAFACCFNAGAQVTFNPAIFTADDQVTLTVDVSGTPMAGQSEAYIWIFSNPTNGTGPQVDGSVNGSWGSSGAGAKMTSTGTNKWSFTFTGTTLFNLSPGQLKAFGFLVKAKDGTKQSPDYKPFAFDPLVFTPSVFRVFPAKVGQDDAVTLNFHQDLATEINEQRLTPTSVTVTVFDQAGIAFGQPVNIQVRNLGNRVFAATFIATNSWTVPAATKLSKFTYKFNGTVPNAAGVPTTTSTNEIEVPFLDLK